MTKAEVTKRDVYIAIDIETTGLSPDVDTILECAWLAFDATGAVLATFTAMNSFRTIPAMSAPAMNLHLQSGLLQELVDNSPDGGVGVDEALVELLDYILQVEEGDLTFTRETTFYWSGFSVHFDLNFLVKNYFEAMTELASHFSHRRLDLSPVKMIAKNAEIELPKTNTKPHRALHDCYEVIDAYKFFLNAFSVLDLGESDDGESEPAS